MFKNHKSIFRIFNFKKNSIKFDKPLSNLPEKQSIKLYQKFCKGFFNLLIFFYILFQVVFKLFQFYLKNYKKISKLFYKLLAFTVFASRTLS